MAAADGSATPEEGVVDQPQPDEDELLERGMAEDLAADAAEAAPDLGKVPVELEPAEVDSEAAALAETQETNHKVTYKAGDVEVQIQLPPKLLASFKYRVGALDDDDPGILKLIKRLVGPVEYEAVMDAMDAADLFDDEGEPNEEAMTSFGNLLNDALATYGLTPGKSKASTNS